MKSVPQIDEAFRPLGPYSVVSETAGLVFLSGQVGIDPSTGDRCSEDVADQTDQILSNIATILASIGLGLEDVVKTTIFLRDMDDYPRVNEIYAAHFEGGDAPARSAVAAAGLPGGYRVEIEAIAAR